MAFFAPNFDMDDQNVTINPELNTFSGGFASSAATQLRPKHPLEESEASYKHRMDQMHLSLLRKTQGLAAPLKLSMERKAASQIGRHRFLPSSNFMLEVLEGRDGDIGFEDLFYDHQIMYPETAARPHVVMERSFGMPK